MVPTDPASRFSLSIAKVAGQASQKNLIFGPLTAGRNYQVLTSADLTLSSWSALPGLPPTLDHDSQRTVTDVDATAARKFYRVEITKP